MKIIQLQDWYTNLYYFFEVFFQYFKIKDGYFLGSPGEQ